MTVLTVDRMPPLARYVPLPHEIERRRRIRLCVATYAYEVADAPIMSDLDWDHMAQSIDPRVGTAHPVMDEFFRYEFSPMTGMWIHRHPELDGIVRIHTRYWIAVRDHYEALYRKGGSL